MGFNLENYVQAAGAMKVVILGFGWCCDDVRFSYRYLDLINKYQQFVIKKTYISNCIRQL